ncbi:MAG: hypothetical protein NTZ59_08050 [Bacteroidetes bacterium]|nr:hypothetical protein [Bacteroidota bacterium]
MFRLVVTLYAICYACYIFYTREPDYFDGETTIASISISSNKKAIASYKVDSKIYSIDADYVFRSLHQGEETTVIYNPAHPEKAAVYSIWGYWFTWGELLLSSVLLFLLFQLSVGIIKNPTEELSENDADDETYRQKKYV